MNDRVCPSCGKAALSVATRCPRCGCAFDARYDRQIDSRPRRPKVPAGLLIVFAVVAVVAANFLWKSGRLPRRPVANAPPPVAAPVKVPEPPRQPAPVASEPVTQPTPGDSDQRVAPAPPATAPSPPARVVAPSSEPVNLGAGERRFATTWINVRAVRSNQSRVVRVLRPGEAVQVDSLGQGWYRIVSGEPGYADRRLLATAPPANTP